MDIHKWDFKVDGYHPSDPGLRKKLTAMGFSKILLREIQPGGQIATKNVDKENQAVAILGGRLFMKVAQETQALHQGDIMILPPEIDYQLKASGNVPTKVLLAKKAVEPTNS